MRLFLASMVAAAALAGVAGCGGNVVVEPPGASSSGGLGGGGNGGAGTAGDGSGGGIVDPTGGPVSPGYAVVSGQDFVQIHFVSQPLSCQDPSFMPSGCDWWLVDVVMPDYLFAVGTIDLASPELKVFMQASDAPDPNGCGSAVGGGGLPGTLIIHSISATEAQLELQNISVYFPSGGGDGVYLAPICN